jgi:hypothetical protein
MSDYDHNFPANQHPLYMDLDISLDDLNNSNGCHVAIVGEAEGSSAVNLVLQESFNNHAYSPSNMAIVNSSVDEKHSQIGHPLRTGSSFNNEPVPGEPTRLLNPFNTHISSIYNEQSPSNEFLGNIFPSHEFVLPGTNLRSPLFNLSDESPFAALDVSCSSEYQYVSGVNGFALSPSRSVHYAPVKRSDISSDSSSHGETSDGSVPLLCYSPISTSSDQTTVSIKIRTLYFNLD